MISLLWSFFRIWLGNKTQHLLLILQNNNELRGGGGFITQLLDIELGRRSIRLHFRHDHHELRGAVRVVPPKDIQKHLKLNHWFFRDSNIFGDFEKSAKRVIESYGSMYADAKCTGVIAINYSLLEQIIKVIGAIQINGINFNDKNLFYELSTIVSNVDFHNFEAGSSRKWVLKALFKKVIRNTVLKVWKWPKLIVALRSAIRTKDVQVYMEDQQLQQKLIYKKVVTPFSSENCSDAFAIVENNYLGLKTNRYLKRVVNREVHFEFDKQRKTLAGANVKVTLEVQHCGGFDYPISGTYQGVITLYFLKTVTKLGVMVSDTQVETGEEGEFVTKSFHYILKVGHKLNVEISYYIPAKNLASDHYSFKYIKQSGTVHEHMHEVLNFPEHYSVVTQTVHGVSAPVIMESKCFIDGANLQNDYTYEVRATLNHRPPRIFYHEIVAPQTIDIRFNEVVTFSSDALQNIQVIAKDSGKVYKPQSYEFRNEGKWLYIHMRNLPEIPEQFYQVVLTNLENDAGINLPSSREITVVYRPKLFRKTS